jgi:hypothetical protein|tara:strand:- start:62 stop:409 length:348 start_codon:yes stop_codon:yes gene_type:complete
MDLLKMHPMARKMELAQKAFLTALEDGDAQMAKQQLTEVQKLSDFLAGDLENEIAKSDVVTPVGPRDIFAGGVPVMKFEEPSNVQIESGNRLGFMSSNRLAKNYKRSAGSYGRRV